MVFPATKKEIRPATLAELEVLVEEMPASLGAVVLLCAWCALRVGEVLELRRRDLDLDRSVVSVTRRCRGSVANRSSAPPSLPQAPGR